MSDLPPLDCLAHFVLGEGKVLIQSALVDGNPSIGILHSKFVGVPGEDSLPGDYSAEDPEVLKRAVVLTFKSEAHRDAVIAALLELQI